MPLYAAYATHTHECHSGLLIGALRELSNNPKIASRRTFTIKQKFTTHQLAYLITYLLHSFDLLAGHHTTHTLHPASRNRTPIYGTHSPPHTTSHTPSTLTPATAPLAYTHPNAAASQLKITTYLSVHPLFTARGTLLCVPYTDRKSVV